MAPSEDEAAEVCRAVQLPEMLHMKPAIVETSPTNCVFFSWSHRTINNCYLLLPLKFGSSIVIIYLALTGSYAWKIRRDSQHGNGTNQNFELDISVRAETMSKSGHPRCLHRNPRAAANATHAAAAAIVRLHSIFRVGRPHRTWVLLELRPSFCAWNGWEVTLRGHMKNSWQMWDDTLYTLDGLNVAMHLLHVVLQGGNQLWSGWTVELGEQGLCKNIPVKTVKPMHLVAQSRIPDPIWSNHYGLIGVEWYITKNTLW
jgi:hypothetical protein